MKKNNTTWGAPLAVASRAGSVLVRESGASKLGGQETRRIAVVRMLRGLGDLLCVVPALRALRAAFPHAYIALIGLHSARQFVTRFHHYIDELVECPGFPGIPETPVRIGDIPVFLKSMQKRSFDVAIQMHGNGTITNPFTLLLGARVNAGFYLSGQFCPDKERFLPYSEAESEVLRYLHLMEFMGVPSQGHELEFPLWKGDRQTLSDIPEVRHLWQKDYICIHPGAHDPGRRWVPERFAAVADALCDRGLAIVLTGDSEEIELNRRIDKAIKNEVVDLTGRTTMGALGVLLSRARMLICNDTGISHVAAALQVPSVVVFTNSNPERWAPVNRDLHRPVYVAALKDLYRPSVDEGALKRGRSPDGGGGRMARFMPSAEEVIGAAYDLLFQRRIYGSME